MTPTPTQILETKDKLGRWLSREETAALVEDSALGTRVVIHNHP